MFGSATAKTELDKVLGHVSIRNMPRHPKPENRQNALRKLRGLLSPNGDAAPIKQWELERLIDVPVATIRAIEAGRRNLNPDVLRKVRVVTRFDWHERLQVWMWNGRPAQSPDWQFLKKFFQRRSPGYEIEIHFLHRRLDAMFEKVLGKDWQLLANWINDCFEECKDDFKLQGLEERFRDTSPETALELYKAYILPGPLVYTARVKMSDREKELALPVIAKILRRRRDQ